MKEGLHHVGHSTHLLVFGGLRVLTDPWVREPADTCLSHRPAPAPLPSDPDVILITHAHGDHFDPTALERLSRTADVVVPLEKMAAKARALGFSSIHLVSPGDTLTLRGMTVDVVLGKHDVYEVCYRLEFQGRSVFFGGDTMLTKEITELARAKPVSLAILPGEHSSFLGKRFVMTPQEAVSLAKVSEPRRPCSRTTRRTCRSAFRSGGWCGCRPSIRKSFRTGS